MLTIYLLEIYEYEYDRFQPPVEFSSREAAEAVGKILLKGEKPVLPNIVEKKIFDSPDDYFTKDTV